MCTRWRGKWIPKGGRKETAKIWTNSWKLNVGYCEGLESLWTPDVSSHLPAIFYEPLPGANEKDWDQSTRPKKVPLNGKNARKNVGTPFYLLMKSWKLRVKRKTPALWPTSRHCSWGTGTRKAFCLCRRTKPVRGQAPAMILRCLLLTAGVGQKIPACSRSPRIEDKSSDTIQGSNNADKNPSQKPGI